MTIDPMKELVKQIDEKLTNSLVLDRLADVIAKAIQKAAFETTTMGFMGPPRTDPNGVRIFKVGEAAQAIAKAILLDRSSGVCSLDTVLRDVDRIEIERLPRRGDMDDWPRIRVRLIGPLGDATEVVGPDPDRHIRALQEQYAIKHPPRQR